MGYLPHIYPIGATFFITFRLADSLPQHMLKALKTEYKTRELIISKSKISQSEKADKINNLRKKIFGKYDNQLDIEPYGKCHMNDIKIAKIIWDKVFEYSGVYYNVTNLSIMPNHVHMLLDTSIQVPISTDMEGVPENYLQVNKWMQLIKGGSSYEINKYLGRKGVLWEQESYDHFVRFNKEGEYQQIKNYIELNPINAKSNKNFLKVPYHFRCNE